MIALIGAGPSGLAGARNLQKLGIPFQGFETYADVGGLWNIHNPRSTVYESAHLISSKRMTEFSEFPMPDSVADYPSHRELLAYFQAFAEAFDLRRHYRFNTRVIKVEPVSDAPDTLWRLTTQSGDAPPEVAEYKGSGGGQWHLSRTQHAQVSRIVCRRALAHLALQERHAVPASGC
ncbi:MAG: hypothetical protein R3E42_12390 [Burkholderiaceae bacterium]